MALAELQPRIKFGEFEFCRRVVRPLDERDVVTRSTESILDSFAWATYPRITVEVTGENDVIVT